MTGNLCSRQALLITLLLCVLASFTNVITNGTVIKNDSLTSTVNMESFLEYHFHTYFDVNDPAQVAQAIQLRNEVIANCVAKKIIAVPLHYHYDPDNAVLEHYNDTTGLNMWPLGPHPIGSFETWVSVEYFAKLYEFFVQKHSSLTVFVHPLTKHELADHTDRIVFMGKPYNLNTDTLRRVVPNFRSQYEYLKLGYAKPKE